MSHSTLQESNETANQFNIEYSARNETRLCYNFENRKYTLGIGIKENRSIEELIEMTGRTIARITAEETEQYEKD